MASFQQQNQQNQNHQQYANNNNNSTTNSSVTNTTTASDLSLVTGIPISFDPETSPIPGQQAWVILNLYGTIIRSSSVGGEGVNNSNTIIKDVPILYNMLIESTAVAFCNGGKQQEGLNRMTINFDDSCGGLRYVIARDENHIYLIQTKK
mmetsp:Transcript_15818/g.17973  ORF Transcript_15818/g.17973 Transcript_15818/m.17973 type:complete len:150 (-) Transcript_15818:129-578(-)